MTEELEPCPFCGSKANLFYVNGGWEVTCDSCFGAISGCHHSKEYTIEAWNTRA